MIDQHRPSHLLRVPSYTRSPSAALRSAQQPNIRVISSISPISRKNQSPTILRHVANRCLWGNVCFDDVIYSTDIRQRERHGTETAVWRRAVTTSTLTATAAAATATTESTASTPGLHELPRRQHGTAMRMQPYRQYDMHRSHRPLCKQTIGMSVSPIWHILAYQALQIQELAVCL